VIQLEMGYPPFLGQADNKPHSWSQPRNSAEKLIRNLAGRARKATGTRWKLWKFFDFGNANNRSSRNCLGLDRALSTQPLHPAFERPAVEAGPFFYFAIGYRRTAKHPARIAFASSQTLVFDSHACDFFKRRRCLTLGCAVGALATPRASLN